MERIISNMKVMVIEINPTSKPQRIPWWNQIILERHHKWAQKIWCMENSINFISSKVIDEEHAIHSKSDIIEIMIYNEGDEIIKVFFTFSKSLLCKYQIGFPKVSKC